MIILSFESSCDETAAAVVEMSDTARLIRSNVVRSQIDIHKLYGGVVPEIASRAHAEALSSMTYEALQQANCTLSDIDLVATTNTPGLIGALLVGMSFAKAIAYANHIPLTPVNHIRGHVAANYLAHPDLKPPFLALVASGGHTSLLLVKSYTDYITVGRTRDDAIGEAFDKVARIMGLPYPGGAEMDRLATMGDKTAAHFPSAAIHDESLDFSFSGLKTAVVNHLHNLEQKGTEYRKEDIAAAFTDTVVSSVVKKLGMAFDRYGSEMPAPAFVLAGGVAANSHLRAALEQFCEKRHIRFYAPSKYLCGDNAAMIGAQGYFEAQNGVFAGTDLNAFA